MPAFVLAVAGDASGASADSTPAVGAVHSAATVAGCAATAGMALQLPPTPIRTPFRGSVKSAARASSQVPAAAELQGQGPTLASSNGKIEEERRGRLRNEERSRGESRRGLA